VRFKGANFLNSNFMFNEQSKRRHVFGGAAFKSSPYRAKSSTISTPKSCVSAGHVMSANLEISEPPGAF